MLAVVNVESVTDQLLTQRPAPAAVGYSLA
jgi:hypothetical protein